MCVGQNDYLPSLIIYNNLYLREKEESEKPSKNKGKRPFKNG